MQAGVDGLLRDKTRASRIPPLDEAVAAQVVALTLTALPGETTHWTAAALAAACAISVSSVHRIWHSLGRIRFASSRCPTIRSSQPRCAILSAFMLRPRPMPSYCQSTRKAKSRRLTAPSPVYR